MVVESARNPPRKGIANSRRDVFAATHDRGADRDELDLRRRRRSSWRRIRRRRKETPMVRANMSHQAVSLSVETAARTVHTFSWPDYAPAARLA
jgi:hypothetical protein